MKLRALLVLICINLFIPAIGSAMIDQSTDSSLVQKVTDTAPLTYKEDELIVKVRKVSGKKRGHDIHKKMGSSVKRSYRNFGDLSLVKIPKGKKLHEALAAYRADPDVLYAEPNYKVQIQATPNDPSFSSLWGMHNTGQTGGTADADINAVEAWDHLTGSAETIVAVIDTGVDYNHQDLRDNMWTNPGEIPGNGIDDDGNGYVDDVHGINTITGSGDPMDDHFHGTHVSGTIAAAGNNSIGVVGVNWSAKIIACKFIGSGGSGELSDAVECLDYLYDLKTRAVNPVNIVLSSNSWGGGDFSQALHDAIDTHRQAGILFVAAAGNSAADMDSGSHYPAGYDLPNIIAVAASDHTDNIASFSNYGRHSVHVAAPGVSILSTTIGDTYGTYSGTSMAAPHVSGLAALLKSQDPSRDWKTIKNLVIAGGQPIAAASTKTITGRRIRAYDVNGIGSLSCLNQVVAERLQPAGTDVGVAKGEPLRLSYLHIDCGVPNGGVVVSVSDGTQFTLRDDGQDGDQEAGDGVYSATWTPTASGQYTLTFPGSDAVKVRTVKSYKEPVTTTYSYRDITATYLTYPYWNYAAPVVSPFKIFFADDPVGYTKLYASMYGTISFAQTNVPWNNEPLPTGSLQTLIAPLWDDLALAAGGVHSQVLGNTPHRELVVEWSEAVSRWAPIGSRTITFQVVFFENSSDILFNYKEGTLGYGTYDMSATATIGVQTSAALAQQYGYNSPVLSNDLALLWQVAAISASAGPDQFVLPGSAVALDGSHSARGDSLTMAYSWTQTAGTAVTLVGANTSKPTFVAPQTYGTLTFKLTVTGDGSVTSTDSVSIVVNLPPVAEAGQDQAVNYGAAVSLDGSGSRDPNGTIKSYAWTQVAGTTVTLTGDTTATPSFTAPMNGGTLTFQLTVTDDGGQSASDTMNVRVTTPPVAEAGSAQWARPGASVALSSSGSYDPDGLIVNYAWTQTTGPAVVLTGNNTASPSFTAPDGNTTLAFSLTVTDNDGLTASDSVSVNVNTPPVVNAGPDQNVQPGAAVSLDGTGSYDPDGTIASYSWVQTAGAAVTLTGANTSRASFTASGSMETLTFQLIVTDNSGQAVSDSVNVTVNGMFRAAVNYDAGSSPSAVSIVDVNGDGNPDLAVATADSHNVAILLGNGDGTFQPAMSFGAGVNTNSVAPGDFNGDGKIDLAVATTYSRSFSILLGNGDGTFQPDVSFGAGGYPYAVTAGDYNGDGKTDLIEANNLDNNVSVLLGNGDSTFQPAVNYGTGTNPLSITTGDFNGDGKTDLAVVDNGNGKISVLLGNGDGTFQGAVNYSVGSYPQAVAAGDFNGDGKTDLAVGNYTSNVMVLLGNGNGTFQSAVTFKAGTYPNAVAAGDVNGDGKADLAVVNTGSGNVSVLLGNGTSTFEGAVHYKAGSGPRKVVIGDLNKDGKADLVVVNGTGNNVSVLLNTMVRIIPNAGPNGSIACSPLLIMPGGSFSCTVTPAQGYMISDVTVNNTSVGAVPSYTMTNIMVDQTISATFVPQAWQLSVSLVGSGTVTSSPAGIDCGNTCNASFNEGTPVSLSTSPATNYTFSGWSGACAGSGACTVTMSQARSVTATFAPLPLCSAPPSITGPATSSTGGYAITCGSSATTGASYVFEESANSGAWTPVYTGTATSADFISKMNGTYQYRVKATKAGYSDSGWITSGVVIVDLNSPQTTASAMGFTFGTWTSSGIVIMLSATDNNGSGVASGYPKYCVDRVNTCTPDISYVNVSSVPWQAVELNSVNMWYLRYQSVDVAGNVETIQSSQAKLDIQTPVTTASPVSGTYSAPQTVTFSCNDGTGSGCAATYYCQGAGCSPATLYTAQLNISSSTVLRFSSRDTVGNNESIKTETYTITTVPPCMVPYQITVPANADSGSYAVNWFASATVGSAYVLEEKVNSGAWTQVYTGTALSYNLSNKTNGAYQYRVKATLAGYSDSTWTTSGIVTVNLTCSAPYQITVPTNASTGSYSVSWYPSATMGASYVLEESANSGAYVQVYTGTAASYAISSKASGIYQYRVKATMAGYADSIWTTSGTVTVALACSAPYQITAPANSSTGNYAVSWYASATPGVTYVLEEKVNSGAYAQVYTGTAKSYPFSSKANGTYQYRVKAILAGNADSTWTTSSVVTVALTCSATYQVTAPATSASGSYSVSWYPSATTGGTYVLEEKVNSGSWASVTSGTATSRSFSGKTSGTYQYRVKVTKSGYVDSNWTNSGVVTVP